MTQAANTTADTTAAPPLYAVFDLGFTPVTFDVMNFLVFANLWTLRAGFAGYHLVFVLGPQGRFRDLTPKDKALDDDEKIWRLRHVLLTHAHIAKRCLGVSHFDRREDLANLLRAVHPNQLFPPNYTVASPKTAFMLPDLFRNTPTREELDTFEAHASALRKVDTWLARFAPRGRPVTLTLRVSTIEPDRNSNVEAWLEAAARIRDAGFDPIVVPDTDLVTSGQDVGAFRDIPSFGIGAVDLELRIALYRRSLINLADNGGPAFINYFMGDSSAVCFLPVEKLPSVVTATGRGVDRMAELIGVEPYGDFPNATPRRRFVWEPDTLGNILQAFERAAAALPEAGPSTS